MARLQLRRRHEHGATLVAIMVALVISFTVSLGVYSSLAMFEGNRRSLVGGDTVLENALAAMSEVQRGIKHAGASVLLQGSLYCPTINIYYDGDVIADNAPLAPVLIADGGSGSDRVTVTYSNSLFGSMQNRVVEDMPTPSAILKVNTSVGLAVSDLFLIGMPGSSLPCSLKQVTSFPPAGPSWVDVQTNPGASGPWNPPNPATVFSNAPRYPAGSILMRIGRFNWLAYEVVNNRLQVTDLITDTTEVIAEHVVAMKAWYGTSDGTNKNIEQWIRATGSWAAPSATQITAVRGVQLAMIVRNPNHYKTTRSDGACDATTTASVEMWPAGPAFDLATLGADWSCFKYRTVSLVVPLRNVIYGE